MEEEQQKQTQQQAQEEEQCVRGGNATTTEEELGEVPRQQEQEGQGQEQEREAQVTSAEDSRKEEESEDEGTGEDLPESCDNSDGDEEPVTGEVVGVNRESECVEENQDREANSDVIGSAEDDAQHFGSRESPLKDSGDVKEEVKEEPYQEEEFNKENYHNGSTNERLDPEEQQLTREEEENNKNREQENGDLVDFRNKEIRNTHEESQQSISELKSKWDSIGKEQNSPPASPTKNYGDNNMADTAKTSRFGGTAEKCNQCQKTVYAMERLEVAGRLMHKTCFRCSKCNSPLSVGRFSVGGGALYCMTHYKQAFREKGTYDVFTPDNPIKGKWQNKPAE